MSLAGPSRGAFRWQQVGAWALACAALVGVYLLYQQPDFMVMLAQQVLACF